MIPLFHYSIFLLLLVLSAGIFTAAQAQTNPPSGSTSSTNRSMRCPAPANPHKMYRECAGRPFDMIEDTLSKDWAGLRKDLNQLGITPILSYTSQFIGNPSGGQSRGFTYAGTLQGSIFWDLDKLLRIPGLSFNVVGAWSTGKNLSADYIGNTFTAQSTYTAPGNGSNNLTLGEIYLQQQLFNV